MHFLAFPSRNGKASVKSNMLLLFAQQLVTFTPSPTCDCMVIFKTCRYKKNQDNKDVLSFFCSAKKYGIVTWLFAIRWITGIKLSTRDSLNTAKCFVFCHQLAISTEVTVLWSMWSSSDNQERWPSFNLSSSIWMFLLGSNQRDNEPELKRYFLIVVK